jgi:integrase
MSLSKRGKIWWYEFWFAGRRIQESSKSSSKTVAKQAEQQRRRELESGFNNIEDERHRNIRTLRDQATDYLESYGLRNRSETFARYAIKHLLRFLGGRMLVDIDDAAVREYQDSRLKEKAAPKSINEEVGFLLRLLEERGELIRAQLKRQKCLKLKVRNNIAKVYSPEEKTGLVAEARRSRSPHMYPALMLAQNAGMRDTEIRTVQWKHLDLKKKFLIVAKSKTDAGEGRTIPLNSALYEALSQHAVWFELRFGRIEPEWYLFPFGKSKHLDPSGPVTTLKTAWKYVKKRAKLQGRLHDSRHTLITELAEGGVGDQTIMDIAGHVSKQMLKHYTHIRMQAKRDALESVVKSASPSNPEITTPQQQCDPLREDEQKIEGVSLQKSLQSGDFEGHRKAGKARKSLKRFGSSGRIRTYNPSVNSRKRALPSVTLCSLFKHLRTKQYRSLS